MVLLLLTIFLITRGNDLLSLVLTGSRTVQQIKIVISLHYLSLITFTKIYAHICKKGLKKLTSVEIVGAALKRQLLKLMRVWFLQELCGKSQKASKPYYL